MLKVMHPFSTQVKYIMSAITPPSTSLRWAVALALGFGLAACSDKPAPTVATPAAPSATAAAEAAATQAAQQQAATLAALSVDELKDKGRQALREQRIYSPAGNNAMEYYIALRKKSDKPDASAESALMDLQPYAVIAAEQALTRDNFPEAERLRNLIAAADPQAPALTRISQAIAAGKAAAEQRVVADAARSDEQTRAQEAARLRVQQEALAAAATPAAPSDPTATPATPAPAVETPAPVASTPAPAVAAPPPAPTPRPAQPAPRPANALVAVNAPQPAYPPEARRSNTSGEVVVSFTVNADGSVSDISIVSARPRGVFERSVQSALRRWEFQPISGSQNVTRTFNFAP